MTIVSAVVAVAKALGSFFDFLKTPAGQEFSKQATADQKQFRADMQKLGAWFRSWGAN